MDKERSRQIRVEIRHILMAKWDPIGVSDIPEATDEYDRYVGEIYELLKSRATEKEISQYLIEVETDRMGLTDKCGNPLVPAETRSIAVLALQLANFFPAKETENDA